MDATMGTMDATTDIALPTMDTAIIRMDVMQFHTTVTATAMAIRIRL